jgi:hypothetical protein
MLPIEKQKTIYNTERDVINLGLVKGRNCLLKNGYTPCENPIYYEKDGIYWHYNHLSKCWYTE